MKVLVVKDNEISSEVIATILENAGYAIDVAKNGADALNLYTTNDYAFIFMDVGLPDCDGLAVTRQIRKFSARDKHVPIIALTAHSDEQTREVCLSAGMNDFLTKPIDPKLLLTIVTKYANMP